TGVTPALAASAPVCGTGDHGLLKELQQKHMSADSSPLSFADIQFLSATTGRAAGNGFMIGTSDGGCTFQTIYEGQWSFRTIEFPDNVYGWALASVQEGQPVYLIRTADGGSHWKRLSNGPVSFTKVQFTDRG
ncbi:WD40/YVTN/BNR-like repeat-containing protein, partial [Paenibacillus zanthoxyli]|uniref:WD40/YVTN/BNR-like repeat-containing protein n=1 Tax=Paenibacillus zanthoxyli TaxID=369399 RepID=UPI0005623F88